MVTVRTTSTTDDDVADSNVDRAGDRSSTYLAAATVCRSTLRCELVSKSVAGAHRALTERLAHILLYQGREVRITDEGCAELAELDPGMPSQGGSDQTGLGPIDPMTAYVMGVHASGKHRTAVTRCARPNGTRRKRLHAVQLTSAGIAGTGGADRRPPHNATHGDYSR